MPEPRRPAGSVPPAIVRAYERGRAQHAVMQAAPLLALALLGGVLLGSGVALGVGSALFGFAAFVFWRGGPASRTIGVAAWLAWLPPTLVLLTESCGGPASWVAVVIASSVLLACGAVARTAVQRDAGVAGWLCGSILVAGAGASGCLCLGAGSVVALLALSAASASLSLPLLATSVTER